MKLHELIEGTWSYPRTAGLATMLKDLMAGPIPVRLASNVLHRFVGDDVLFDNFYDAEKHGPETDIRSLVVSKLKTWMDMEDKEWKDPWEPEAKKIVCGIIKDWEERATDLE